MNKPNALWHMSRWGLISGTILALLYMLFFLSMGMDLQYFLFTLISPAAWFYAFLFGGLPGLALGFMDGLLLWATMRNAPIPFTRADMQAYRKRVYASMGLATFIGASLLSLIFFGLIGLENLWFVLMFPPIIAGIAAAYAGHRYLFRLRLWSEAEFGLRKEKAKNTEHLEDKLKHEEAELEDEAQNRGYKIS